MQHLIMALEIIRKAAYLSLRNPSFVIVNGSIFMIIRGTLHPIKNFHVRLRGMRDVDGIWTESTYRNKSLMRDRNAHGRGRDTK